MEEDSRTKLIKEKIELINKMAVVHPMTGAEAIQIALDYLQQFPVTRDIFEEHYDEAILAFEKAETKIIEALEERIKWEADNVDPAG